MKIQMHMKWETYAKMVSEILQNSTRDSKGYKFAIEEVERMGVLLDEQQETQRLYIKRLADAEMMLREEDDHGCDPNQIELLERQSPPATDTPV